MQGIANSSPMDYKQVIRDFEVSDLSKGKEMIQILDDIKQKSLFFGDSDDGFYFLDTDITALIPDIDLSDESKELICALARSSSHSDDNSSIGIKKDYSTDEGIKTSEVFEEKIDVMDPNQIYKVQCDEKLKELLEKSDGGWKYVATLKAVVESCSEEEEEGEKTEITEVKQIDSSRMDVWRFYGKKVLERCSSSRDKYRLSLLKKFVTRDHAEKAKHRLKNQSDSMHSDTSTLALETSDSSIVSNTTYEAVDRKSDEDSDGKKESDVVSEEKEGLIDDKHDEKDGVVDNLHETDTASLLLGSMWSDGPSATDNLKLSTVTDLSCAAPSTDTGYTSKEVRKVRKKD